MSSMKSPTPLKLAIVMAGRTQRDVAAAVGMDEVQFSKVVNGQRTPRVDVAVAIADSLGRDVSELWPVQGSGDHHTASFSNDERLAA